MVAERFLILETALLILALALIPLACGGQGTQGKIAFTSYRDGNWGIYVMDADGSNLIHLINDPSDDLDHSWSPDGTKIAFTP